MLCLSLGPLGLYPCDFLIVVSADRKVFAADDESIIFFRSTVIDGHETAANLRLSVGSEVAGRVWGVVNSVHVW